MAVRKTDMMWPCALYIRLSHEDGDKDESDSIVNQRALLSAFAAEQPDLSVADVCVDDGFTGSNFERPAFQRMMAGVTAGRIRCVVVKDLSRFGRNYIEAGRYLEQVFPAMGVRFISVNDRIDSYADPASASGLLLPFRNLINDEYCRDISQKVRSALDIKRRQGQFIGSFAPYGYKKSPDDRNRLAVDGETAPVVREIYRLFLAGQGIKSIARQLSALRLPTPAARRAGTDECLWSDSSVRRILTNPVYCGHAAQGKRRSISHRLNRSLCVPPEEWTVVRNTHEGIISEEDFERAARLIGKNAHAAPEKSCVYPLSGLLFCADCGRPMHRKTIAQPYGVYAYYICSGYKKHRVCTKHTVRADLLEHAVSETIARQIELCVSAKELLAALKRGSDESRRAPLEKRLTALEDEKRRVARMKLALYPDLKSGLISQADYVALRAQFEEKLEGLERAAALLADALRREDAAPARARDGLEHFIRHHRFRVLSRDMAADLIERIDVREGGKIDIQFRYRDELAALEEP
ncbi:MAG: recombinase family protein [Clostridia bacterium]|nr:recombinase family protein [Clostridia bacterium]